MWDGQAWRAYDLAPVTGLNGVWLRGDTVHAVGTYGGLVQLDFLTGAATAMDPLATSVDWHAIHGTEDWGDQSADDGELKDEEGGLVAVGGNFVLADGPYKRNIATQPILSGE